MEKYPWDEFEKARSEEWRCLRWIVAGVVLLYLGAFVVIEVL